MVFPYVIWFCLVFVSDCCAKESLSVMYDNTLLWILSHTIFPGINMNLLLGDILVWRSPWSRVWAWHLFGVYFCSRERGLERLACGRKPCIFSWPGLCLLRSDFRPLETEEESNGLCVLFFTIPSLADLGALYLCCFGSSVVSLNSSLLRHFLLLCSFPGWALNLLGLRGPLCLLLFCSHLQTQSSFPPFT